MTTEHEVSRLKNATVEELCNYLAAQIRRARTQRKESQSAFATRAGISLRTFKRLELHGKGHLETFVKALKALDCSDYLRLLFPQAPISGPRTFEEKIVQLRAKQEAAGIRRDGSGSKQTDDQPTG